MTRPGGSVWADPSMKEADDLSFTITHRIGRLEHDPSSDSLPALLNELDHDDPEHPDIAVSHEGGWTLSAFPGGLVAWEDVEQDDEPRHMRDVSRERLIKLLTALAEGDLDTVEQEAWVAGYP
jgi:hypothetical protein